MNRPLVLALAAAAALGAGGVRAQSDAARGLKAAEAAQVYAESRVALVIGNGAYKDGPLRNPPNDAADVAAALEARRFEVIKLVDADQRAMEEGIREFGTRLKKGGTGLFYYSGHGIQAGGVNYLLPVNADIREEKDIPFESVDAGRVLAEMETAQNRLNIMILDACRDNPFARSFKTATRGLVKMDAPTGTLISYATGPGRTAADGDGRNGVYTAHLLRQMQAPGLRVELALKQVREGVRGETRGAQVPWELSSLTGDFFFTPIDFLEGQVGVKQEELERLRKLDAEQRATETAQQATLEKSRNELDSLDRQIEALKKDLNTGVAGHGSLAQLAALVEQREQQAAAQEAQRLKLEEDRGKAQAEIARLKAQETAKRKTAFETDWANYVKVRDSRFSTDELRRTAWQSICANWKLDASKAPSELSWDDENGCVCCGPGRPAQGKAPSTGPGRGLTVDLNGVKMELVWIAPGEFMMGEGTPHRVKLTKGFWMGKYEVTQEQWERVMGSNPSHFKNAGKSAPVEMVSWDDCQEFVRKLNGLSGALASAGGGGAGVQVFRLPTEAEWEYACQAGTTTRFSTGDSDSDLDRAGWYAENSGNTTHPVGQKAANAWGLYDMHGNVWEWCADWYRDYPSGMVADPSGPSSGSSRVLRGGAWDGNARSGRSAYRFWFAPALRSYFIGFRVVVAAR